MNRIAKQTAALALAVAAALVALPAGAIELGWTAGPMSSTGDTICTNGTLVYAYAVQSVTVGDVSFVRTPDLDSADMVSVSPNHAKLSGGSFGDDGATGDYAAMLRDGWSWGSNGDGNYLAYTLTLFGLEAGKTYLVQLVCHRQSNSMLVSANGSNSVHVHGADEANYKYGASITGVFMATASTENVVVTYTNQTGDRPLNAIQVRELPSDEPAEKPAVITVK